MPAVPPVLASPALELFDVMVVLAGEPDPRLVWEGNDDRVGVAGEDVTDASEPPTYLFIDPRLGGMEGRYAAVGSSDTSASSPPGSESAREV